MRLRNFFASIIPTLSVSPLTRVAVGAFLVAATAAAATASPDNTAVTPTVLLDGARIGDGSPQNAPFTPVPRILRPFLAAVTPTPIVIAGSHALVSSPENPAGPVLARQAGCQASFTACTNVGQPGVCCQSDTICTTDNAHKAACCPRGAACTGNIGGGAGGVGSDTTTRTSGAPSVMAGSGGADTGTGQSTLTITVTAGYSIPESVSGGGGGAGAGAGTAGPTGTVPNAPFPFAYIPHSFSNAAQCTSYARSCSSTFSSCTAALGGGGDGGGGVTVVGAGITTANGGGLAYASAASVCSSLSSQACYGLQTQQCSAYGTANSNGAAARPVAELLQAGLGLGLGVLGAVVA